MSMIAFLTLLLHLQLIAPQVLLHPIYISLGLIDHNPEEQTLDITLKVFTDDLQDAIQKFSNRDDLYIGYDDELAAVDSTIATYMNAVIQFRPEGKSSEMHYLGKEIELDVTWCYFRVHDVADLEKLETTCTLFTELFATQSTLMHVKRNGEEKSMLFKRDRTEQSVDFSD